MLCLPISRLIQLSWDDWQQASSGQCTSIPMMGLFLSVLLTQDVQIIINGSWHSEHSALILIEHSSLTDFDWHGIIDMIHKHYSHTQVLFLIPWAFQCYQHSFTFLFMTNRYCWVYTSYCFVKTHSVHEKMLSDVYAELKRIKIERAAFKYWPTQLEWCTSYTWKPSSKWMNEFLLIHYLLILIQEKIL